MNILKNGLILAFFLACAMIAACGGAAVTNTSDKSGPAANSANDNADTAKANADELSLLVNMPFEAEEVLWKDDAQHKKLIAVLRFSADDSKKLIAEAEKIKAPEKVTLSTETWFPPELIAQGDMNGDDSVKGLAYPANAFFQEPYAQGRITRIEDSDYFVLELSAK